MTDILQTMWELTASLPTALQWFGVMLAGAIPLLEGHGATALGIAVGVHPILATAAGILGNVAVMLIVAAFSSRLRERLLRDNKKTERREKIHRLYNRYGVPVVSIVAEFWLPSALTTVLLVSFGAQKKQVMVWQAVAIVIWSVGTALLLTGVIHAVLE